ncbi:hypothetical protein [Actinospica robiniae]|uniref:hypothetical protein n=1 Tax=Actinospica robiniae TaxID=304901 RepID=UPI0004013860|nr:hypothetical protein [Actinospica robiniae]
MREPGSGLPRDTLDEGGYAAAARHRRPAGAWRHHGRRRAAARGEVDVLTGRS